MHPIVCNMIRVWYEVREYMKIADSLSQFSPIWANTLFKPGTKDSGFRLLVEKGLSKISDLFEEGTLMSFEQISTKYKIPRKHFFKYLQIRSFVLSMQNHSLNLPVLSSLEEITTKKCNNKGLISVFYNWLTSGSTESSTTKLELWKVGLNEDISEDEWRQVCKNSQKQLGSVSLKLLQYNWLMQTYITPVKLNRFNKNIPVTCFKCR